MSEFNELTISSNIEIKKNNNPNNNEIIDNNNLKTQIPNIKVRDNIWDNYKGILIFLVVYAHFLWEYSEKYENTKIDYLVTFIYIFHMPAFIFCSGFFSKSTNSKSRRTISKLFIHYIIFNTLLMVYEYYFHKILPNIFYPQNSYWYLFSLISWRMIIPYFENEYFLILKSFLIGLIVGYDQYITINLLSFKRTFAFFPFFVLGYKIKKKHFKRLFNLTNKLFIKIIFIITFFTYSYILYNDIKKRKINFTHKMLLMGFYNYNNEILKRIQLFIISLIMIFLLLFSLPNKKIPIITMIGRNSLYVYLFHRVFTLLFFQYYQYKINLVQIMKKSLKGTIIIVIVFGNDYITKIMNLFVDFLYINISLNNKKGRFIKLIFFLLLILIILSKPIHEKYNSNKKNI